MADIPHSNISPAGVSVKCEMSDSREKGERTPGQENVSPFSHGWKGSSAKSQIPVPTRPVGFGIWDLGFGILQVQTSGCRMAAHKVEPEKGITSPSLRVPGYLY